MLVRGRAWRRGTSQSSTLPSEFQSASYKGVSASQGASTDGKRTGNTGGEEEGLPRSSQVSLRWPRE